MHVLINALSATNLSGRQVLQGHLNSLSRHTAARHEYTVLFHPGNAGIRLDLGERVKWMECPADCGHWFRRSVFERRSLPELARRLGVHVYLGLSGMALPGMPVPQVCMALNPWSLVRRTQRTVGDKVKGALQRRAYRDAVRRADMMAYASNYMRDIYRANAGREERRGEIVYPAVSDATWKAVEGMRGGERQEDRILCVSVMAPHKSVETLVDAMSNLRGRHGIAADLHLIGPWPLPSYEKAIRKRVRRAGLEARIHIEGKVERKRLLEHYVRARVYALMSWCESFGIPSVEAQACGTPTVLSDCCAMREVCAGGGLYAPPGDARRAADALATLLRDEKEWDARSRSAVANAARFHYEKTSLPLARMFELEMTDG